MKEAFDILENCAIEGSGIFMMEDRGGRGRKRLR